MIFIDSNIPMYLVGAPHRHKDDTLQLLEWCIANQERLVTDVEVLQEILHRYTAINRREAIQPSLEALLGVVDEVYSVELIDVMRAKQILLDSPLFSARDALHLAIMERHRIKRIMSFDAAFDHFPGIVRLLEPKT